MTTTLEENIKAVTEIGEIRKEGKAKFYKVHHTVLDKYWEGEIDISFLQRNNDTLCEGDIIYANYFHGVFYGGVLIAKDENGKLVNVDYNTQLIPKQFNWPRIPLDYWDSDEHPNVMKTNMWVDLRNKKYSIEVIFPGNVEIKYESKQHTKNPFIRCNEGFESAVLDYINDMKDSLLWSKYTNTITNLMVNHYELLQLTQSKFYCYDCNNNGKCMNILFGRISMNRILLIDENKSNCKKYLQSSKEIKLKYRESVSPFLLEHLPIPAISGQVLSYLVV